MTRLAALSLLLAAIFSLMIGATMRIGHRQPIPERIQALHLADCSLPCWNGITPGKTSLKEAKARVDATFADFEGSSSEAGDKFLTWTEVDDISRIVSVVDITFENGLASTVSIGTDHRSDQMPTLGEVLAIFGSPSCIDIKDEAEKLRQLIQGQYKK